jgi:hypothetical protein
MGYVRHSETPLLSTDLVKLLAGLVGLSIPPEDLDALAHALTDQLASQSLFDRLDLADTDPLPPFDPHWND